MQERRHVDGKDAGVQRYRNAPFASVPRSQSEGWGDRARSIRANGTERWPPKSCEVGGEVIPPWLTTFCPEVDFQIEALWLIHFEIPGQTPSPFIAFSVGTAAES